MRNVSVTISCIIKIKKTERLKHFNDVVNYDFL